MPSCYRAIVLSCYRAIVLFGADLNSKFIFHWSKATILPFGKFRYFDFAQYRSGIREYKSRMGLLKIKGCY